MNQDAAMLANLIRRKPGYGLPGPLYTAQDMYNVDIDSLWAREWLFATAVCSLPKTGSHIMMEFGNYSVIVVRGADGIIRAFHNSCRHRGSRLCKTAQGSSPKLVCPYHQWTYELDGRLLYARDMGDDFDPSAHGLKPVHCRQAGGLVFICVADEAPDFDALEKAGDRFFGPHGVADGKLAHQTSIIENGNWKLVLENNRECYHCAGAHPALCRTFDDRPAGVGVGGMEDPVNEAHYVRCEEAGLPSRYFGTSDTQWRMIRVPLLGAGESYTMDGKVAVSRLMGDMPFADAGTLLFFHYPNTWCHFLGDTCILFRVLPRGPMETEVVTQWIVHKDAEEGKDYDLDRLTEVWLMTNNEDRIVVEENQRGICSPVYEPGPYSVLQEGGVIEFIDWYVRKMTERLAGRSLDTAE